MQMPGLLVPNYTYPSDLSWGRVLAVVKSYPALPVTVIANPNNGVGSSQDPVFLTAIKALQLAGAKVIGYIATGYGSKSLGAIEGEASSWRSFYSVDGVFLDEFDNNPGSESLYSSVHTFVHGLGMPLVFGNPGTTVPSSYTGTVDYLVTWEMGGVPPMTFKGDYIAEGVPSLPGNFPLPDWLWILDGNNSYAVRPLAPYFEQLASVVAGKAPAPPPPGPPSSTSTLVVSTQDAAGNPVTGFYIDSVLDMTAGTTVSAGGTFTPRTFPSLPTGHTLRVTVDDYGTLSVSSASAGTFERITAGGGGAGRTTFPLGGDLALVFTMAAAGAPPPPPPPPAAATISPVAGQSVKFVRPDGTQETWKT